MNEINIMDRCKKAFSAFLLHNGYYDDEPVEVGHDSVVYVDDEGVIRFVLILWGDDKMPDVPDYRYLDGRILNFMEKLDDNELLRDSLLDKTGRDNVDSYPCTIDVACFNCKLDTSRGLLRYVRNAINESLGR